jgi:hypothetical protein
MIIASQWKKMFIIENELEKYINQLFQCDFFISRSLILQVIDKWCNVFTSESRKLKSKKVYKG